MNKTCDICGTSISSGSVCNSCMKTVPKLRDVV